MKEKIACYIRVSTQEQVMHGLSLDAQRDKLKDYAQTHNLDIVDWYEDEGISGRKLIKKRPELQRMLHDAHDKKFERIIFIKLDRFFRSVAEYHECMKYINPVTWTATEEEYDLTTANGRMLVNMKLTIAELEADQTSERIKLVNDYKVKQGQAIYGGVAMGRAFKVERIDGVPKVVHSENEELIKDMIEYFLRYQNVRQTSRYIINKYSVTMDIKTIKSLLSDTRLYGTYRSNSEYCEPYISQEKYNTIQEVLKHRTIKSTPSKKIYLFTGLIKCPECGHSMISRTSCAHRKTGERYASYSCGQYRKFGEKICSCKMCLSENLLEKQLLDIFSEKLTEHIEILRLKEADKKDAKKTQKRIKAIKKEMENLTKVFVKGRIEEKFYDMQYADLEKELKELQTINIENHVDQQEMYADLISSDWKGLYSKLDKERKRAFWRTYIKEMVVDTERTIVKIEFF